MRSLSMDGTHNEKNLKLSRLCHVKTIHSSLKFSIVHWNVSTVWYFYEMFVHLSAYLKEFPLKLWNFDSSPPKTFQIYHLVWHFILKSPFYKGFYNISKDLFIYQCSNWFYVASACNKLNFVLIEITEKRKSSPN